MSLGSLFAILCSVAAAVYIGGGVGYASTAGGGGKKGITLLNHPHLHLWLQLRSLVVDGAAFTRSRVGRKGQGYKAVAGAGAAASAPKAAGGGKDSEPRFQHVEYKSSSGKWIETTVRSDRGGPRLDLAVKKQAIRVNVRAAQQQPAKPAKPEAASGAYGTPSSVYK